MNKIWPVRFLKDIAHRPYIVWLFYRTESYLNKKKKHYISSYAPIDLESDIVKMLRLRDSRSLSQVEIDELGQYYLH